jgi:hypothetical protein
MAVNMFSICGKRQYYTSIADIDRNVLRDNMCRWVHSDDWERTNIMSKMRKEIEKLLKRCNSRQRHRLRPSNTQHFQWLVCHSTIASWESYSEWLIIARRKEGDSRFTLWETSDQQKFTNQVAKWHFTTKGLQITLLIHGISAYSCDDGQLRYGRDSSYRITAASMSLLTVLWAFSKYFSSPRCPWAIERRAIVPYRE